MIDGMTEPSMGVYEAVLGPVEFAKLAPQVQEVFGGTPRWTGRGLFDEVGASNPLVRTALTPMVLDRALPGGYGRDVPFEVSSTLVAGADGKLRQRTVRTFSVEGTARSSVSVTVAERSGVAGFVGSHDEWTATDYLGEHELLSTAVSVSVVDGALSLESSAARLRLGARSLALAGPLGAQAVTTHRWDESRGLHHIDVEVRHPMLGTVLAYRGYFEVEVTPEA